MEQPDNTRDIHIKIMKSLYYLTLFTQWRERLTPDASPGPGFRPGRSARESPSASGVETTREGPAGQRQRLKTTGVETARVRRSGEASSWPSPGARKSCARACRRNPRRFGRSQRRREPAGRPACGRPDIGGPCVWRCLRWRQEPERVGAEARRFPRHPAGKAFGPPIGRARNYADEMRGAEVRRSHRAEDRLSSSSGGARRVPGPWGELRLPQ